MFWHVIDLVQDLVDRLLFDLRHLFPSHILYFLKTSVLKGPLPIWSYTICFIFFSWSSLGLGSEGGIRLRSSFSIFASLPLHRPWSGKSKLEHWHKSPSSWLTACTVPLIRAVYIRRSYNRRNESRDFVHDTDVRQRLRRADVWYGSCLKTLSAILFVFSCVEASSIF